MKNILNEVIREDNVQMLGEIIAIKALKTVASHSNGKLDYLYKGLLFDVYKRNTPNHRYSDGYDFAQTAMLFLWEHKGQKLGDYYGKNGKGKEYNLLYACYHIIDKNLITLYKFNADETDTRYCLQGTMPVELTHIKVSANNHTLNFYITFE